MITKIDYSDWSRTSTTTTHDTHLTKLFKSLDLRRQLGLCPPTAVRQRPVQQRAGITRCARLRIRCLLCAPHADDRTNCRRLLSSSRRGSCRALARGCGQAGGHGCCRILQATHRIYQSMIFYLNDTIISSNKHNICYISHPTCMS